jgi:trk system potassium uptake protein TrkH
VRGRFAPFIIGTGLLALAAAMVVFVIYALLAREPVLGFLVTAVASTLVGAPLARFGSARAEPTRREALVGVLLLWFLMPLFGAIPYAMSDAFTPLNALFESMSGFTATGATVLVDFTKPSSTLFMWRSLTQWFGGIGILLLFIAVFPQLAIAGRQLFFTEAPGPTEERLTPRLRNTAYAVLIVYAGLTTLCALAYLAAGMSLFDAVAHAFTTVSAAGFSPEARSFETFQAPLIEWVAIVFMLFAGANFALQYRAVTGRPRELMRDAEFRAYLVIVAIATATLTLFLWRGEAFWETLRTGLFQVLSILTTTTAREVRQALHPRAVLPVRVGDRVVPEEVIRAVAAFLTLFVGLFALSVVVLVAFGADFVTAFSASIAAVGNIGPGLASVGPMLNFAELHPVSRGVLIFDMYAGRLEVVTVFVIFTSNWWRLPRRATFGSRR